MTQFQPQTKMPRCEGYRRIGGAFTLGPPKWEQCKADATVKLTLVQDSQQQVMPACHTCWNEAIQGDKIRVLEVKPIVS